MMTTFAAKPALDAVCGGQLLPVYALHGLMEAALLSDIDCGRGGGEGADKPTVVDYPGRAYCCCHDEGQGRAAPSEVGVLGAVVRGRCVGCVLVPRHASLRLGEYECHHERGGNHCSADREDRSGQGRRHQGLVWHGAFDVQPAKNEPRPIASAWINSSTAMDFRSSGLKGAATT